MSTLFDANALAERRLEALADAVRMARGEGVPQPVLVIVHDGRDPRAQIWAGLKRSAAGRAGVAVRVVPLPEEEDEALALLNDVCSDPDVHGVFVQEPLLHGIGIERATALIPLARDVDAMSPPAWKAILEGTPVHWPATSLALMDLVEQLASAPGLACTLVSGPEPSRAVDACARMLAASGYRVSSVDVANPALQEHLTGAGLVVAATDRSSGVFGRWIPDGAIVIDAGYWHDDGQGGVVLDAEDAERLGAIVPHRGGVGPLTVMYLLGNTLAAARLTTSGHS